MNDPRTGCWEWTGATRNAGYGAFKADGKVYDTHRFVWNIVLRRPIPEGKVVCHSCDNKLCVNPEHLRLGTQQENIREMYSKGRARNPRGERVKSSKLTVKDVREIRTAYATKKETYKSLAEKYGVDKSSVRLAIIGETWKHV